MGLGRIRTRAETGGHRRQCPGNAPSRAGGRPLTSLGLHLTRLDPWVQQHVHPWPDVNHGSKADTGKGAASERLWLVASRNGRREWLFSPGSGTCLLSWKWRCCPPGWTFIRASLLFTVSREPPVCSALPGRGLSTCFSPSLGGSLTAVTKLRLCASDSHGPVPSPGLPTQPWPSSCPKQAPQLHQMKPNS